jgi:integrase/recombinase XerD
MGTRTTALRERMREALRLRNYAVSTETKYIWHVNQFAHYFGKSPEIMGEPEIRRYLRHLQEERRVSDCQYKQTVAALRFLYADTLGQEWLRGRIPYPRSPKSLLQVLTVDEVRRLFTCTCNLRDLAALKILYGSGLRVLECVSLKVADINSKEMFIHVRHGKGDRERRALLSPALLTALRDYWRRYRPTDWLFPSRAPETHIAPGTLQGACRAAAKTAGITKKVTPHCLRHAFGAHLLEQGTDILKIQELLGHSCLQTTLLYTHVTNVMFRGVISPLDQLNEE